MGNCTITGGIFYYDTYSVVRGADTFLPVDVYIAGCPPRPEALQDGILRLRELIHTRSLAEDRTYERDLSLPSPETPRAGSTDACRGHLLRESQADAGETT
jgi:NADH:ubiquinone oxidoreductase subunit B-like Fe-S oxidoreductase